MNGALAGSLTYTYTSSSLLRVHTVHRTAMSIPVSIVLAKDASPAALAHCRSVSVCAQTPFSEFDLWHGSKPLSFNCLCKRHVGRQKPPR